MSHPEFRERGFARIAVNRAVDFFPRTGRHRLCAPRLQAGSWEWCSAHQRYAIAPATNASSLRSSEAAILATSALPNWPNKEDGLSYSKHVVPSSFS
jgi:hypothetical protein